MRDIGATEKRMLATTKTDVVIITVLAEIASREREGQNGAPAHIRSSFLEAV